MCRSSASGAPGPLRDPGSRTREADEVGEQHRDEAPLRDRGRGRFGEGGAQPARAWPHSPQNLTPGPSGAAVRTLDRQRGPAFAAELPPGLVLGAAGGTDHRRRILQGRGGSLAEHLRSVNLHLGTYRSAVLEARFDDLTGASASFRLVEPVGVLEATRAGEVVATSRPPRRRPGAACGSPGSSPTRPRPASILTSPCAPRPRRPVRGPPARVVRDVRARRGDDAPRPARRGGHAARRRGHVAPDHPRDRYEGSVDRIRELIAAGETYQVNHTMRLRSQVEGDPRGLYRDLATRNAAPTPPTSTSAGTGSCRRRRSCSSRSATARS